jgi:penicillin G amidase
MRAPALLRLLEGQATARDWCDDRTTPQHETCDAVVGAALTAALSDLAKRYGEDRATWRWGRAHVAFGRHAALGELPLIGPLFNIEIESAGGNFTLNRGMVDFRTSRPFASRHAASYRAIYDLADLDHSLYMHSTGQSGNPLAPSYRAFVQRWARVEYIEIATARAAIARAAVGTWRLTPR